MTIVPKVLTEDEWYARFKPRTAGEWSKTQLLAWDKQRLLWTMLEVDGQTVYVNGYHTVNRISYIKCLVPYEPGEHFDVYLTQGDIV